MKLSRFWWCFAVVATTTFFFTSCVTMADYDFTEVNNALSNGDYEAVYQTLEADSDVLYSSRDEVLVSLDKGMVSHYAGDFTRSNTELAVAEQKIFDNFSKSITQSISSFLLNDTVVDYAGETYEDIYTNLFMALNYIHQDDIEDAFVEIRRFDNKLKNVSMQYADLIAQANLSNSENGAETVDAPSVEFHNSALARYLSLVMYRADGRMDSAEIDRKYLKSAFALQPSLYDFGVPSCVDEEFSIPSDMARLNVVAFSGLAPIKVEDVTRFYSYDASIYYKLALPVMQKQPSVVAAIEVSVLDKEGSVVTSSKLEKIESIEAIAMDTFQQRQALLYLKASARALLKSVSTSVLNGLATTGDDDDSLYSLMHLMSVATTEASERADVRSSRYFPATAWVTGVNVASGEYEVVVTYKSAYGSIVKQDSYVTNVEKSSINLMESVCLK